MGLVPPARPAAHRRRADTHALSTIGLQPENERQARDLKEAAKVVQHLEPEQVVAVAQYLKTATGSEKPTTSQVKAAAEVPASIDAHATAQHPDTGTEVSLHTLTGEQRAAAIAENVSTGTHERLQRQKQHIEDSKLQSKSNGRGGWTGSWTTSASTSRPPRNSGSSGSRTPAATRRCRP
ncbi:hypothetical protein GCM10008956_05430 [Deinococcus arenae]|uniref:Uncharacterized protein n=1 Tax=Deinococcus arenae TaxID=1452751 RepID=A0A8H9L464_9DEIO|nr:hypothetical protein GCM10008956_05430 [Deinococcus arenae]